MRKVLYADLDRMDYSVCWELQQKIQTKIIQEKRLEQEGKMLPEDRFPDVLLFVEHPHVYTLGKSGDFDNLLANPDFLRRIEATFYKNDRGGDITYHGPGQLVGYPIFDMNRHFTDLHRYIWVLEEIMIRVAREYGFEGNHKEKLTGAWINDDKLCAIGVKCSRWVTMHGFALNVNTNLDYFSHIVPCGITDKGVTSLKKLTGENVDENEVKEKVLHHFKSFFDVEFEKVKSVKALLKLAKLR